MPSHLHNVVSRAGVGALERLKCSTTRSTTTTEYSTVLYACTGRWLGIGCHCEHSRRPKGFLVSLLGCYSLYYYWFVL
jgi:hypothetical protein